MIERRLSSRILNWLLSRSEGQLCAIVATAFWLDSATNRMLVRGTLLAVRQVPFLATPEVYGLQYLLMAPALVLIHAAAFRIGWPRQRRARALALHVLLMLALAAIARLALDGAAILLEDGAVSAPAILMAEIEHFVSLPMMAVSTGLDIVFQYSIALALIAGVIAWRRYQEAAAARASLALETERTRRMALRRQLDPHSLFNTLNAVAAAIRPTPNTAIAMIAALGDLLRESLQEEREVSTVAEEFTLAGRYLALYALRYPDRLKVSIGDPGGCGAILLPSLLLQPLVENAALHGVESGAAQVEVQLSAARASGDGVEIAIENTVAPEAQMPAPAESPGIGLSNTWHRLVTHYGTGFDMRWERPCADRVRLVLLLPPSPVMLAA